MSYYSDASLVLIPSGYKDQKIYSAKPTDGSGDLVFSRASDATRVDSNGLIEKVRTNIILQSNDFGNATWAKLGTTPPTATSGQADKDGGTNAWLISWGASQGTSYMYQNISNLSTPHTASCWVKGTAGQRILFGYGLNVGQGATITFTGDWQRVSHTSSSGSLLLFSNFLTSPASSFYVQYCQSEAGDIATDYIPTTTAAVSVGPVSGLPRLDYSGGASCPSLLLEPQRTNVYPYSEQLNQWSSTNPANVTANYAVSPDGYQNADRVQFVSGMLVYMSGTGSAGENTLSVYAKATNGTSAKFRFFANGATLFSSDQTATGEWQRFTFTYTYSAETAGLARPTTSVDDVIFYGFQHEVGSYATSYIPTLGAAVTRLADAASKTGISSLIGQTEGTIFVEAIFKSGYDTNNLLLTLSNTSSNMIYLNRSTGQLEARVVASGVVSLTYASPYVLTTGTHKVALAYKANDFAVYLDGTLVHSDTSGSVPACNKLNLGTYFNDGLSFNDGINQALLFKTRLSNAQLAELTTL